MEYINPLVKLHLEKGTPYTHMARTTGISYATIRLYRLYKPEQIVKMSIKRLQLIKDKLKVDMIEGIKDYEPLKNEQKTK